LLEANRELREISDPRERSRERSIKNIEISYGYDRENAEKIHEISRVRFIETAFGGSLGAFAAWKVGPIMTDIAHSIRLFRKPWMRYLGQFSAFGLAYFMGTQLPQRFFVWFDEKNTGVTIDKVVSRSDVVERFRLFENEDGKHCSQQEATLNYLGCYSDDPLSKPELLDQMMKNISKNVDLTKVFRIKRRGADMDDIFYSYGKIHGLENVAFCEDADLEKVEGNPVTL